MCSAKHFAKKAFVVYTRDFQLRFSEARLRHVSISRQFQSTTTLLLIFLARCCRSYELTKRYHPLQTSSPFISHFTAGLIAECFSCVLWLPIDVIKERLQVQSS